MEYSTFYRIPKFVFAARGPPRRHRSAESNGSFCPVFWKAFTWPRSAEPTYAKKSRAVLYPLRVSGRKSMDHSVIE